MNPDISQSQPIVLAVLAAAAWLGLFIMRRRRG